MPITVICQQCQKRFDVPDSYQGREGKCTSCGAPLRVPVQAAPNLTASAEEAFRPTPGAPQAYQQQAYQQQQPAPQQPAPQQGVKLSAPAPAASHVAIGRQVGSYELQRKLGQATSTVFLANSLQGEVAVKVLPAQLVEKNPTVGKRFLREARTLFGLSHPNVIRSHDAGEELGTFFLVMEYFPAADLASLLQQRGGRLPEEEAVRIAIEVAQGLDYLNSNGLLHRNIKPEHVLVDDDGEVKLVGLGLIRQADLDAGGPQVTVKGAVVGTPAYMSPEQARAEELDVRSDLYSLGIFMYELLSGSVPFESKVVAQILRMLTTEPCPDVREKAPHVSEATWVVIKKLTEKKPGDRYSTPTDLLTDLRAINDGALRGGLPPIAGMAAGTVAGASPKGARKTAKRAKPGEDSGKLKLAVAALGVLVVTLVVVLALVLASR